ncbi:unnamed protein product, partial [Laminaria digitata]
RRYLDALSDGALLLRLSMDGDRVVKRASTRAADGGFRDRSLSQLSGGQWRRASLALELAFVELARQRGRFSCNLLVLDEVLSQLDSYGRARVRKKKQNEEVCGGQRRPRKLGSYFHIPWKNAR